jgi:hypothetical protein
MNTTLPLAAFPYSGWFRSLRQPWSLAGGHRLTTSPTHSTSIDKGASLVVERPLGICVTCARGALWITHDGCPKDVVIEAGERYESESNARMIVHGLAASSALVR